MPRVYRIWRCSLSVVVSLLLGSCAPARRRTSWCPSRLTVTGLTGWPLHQHRSRSYIAVGRVLGRPQGDSAGLVGLDINSAVQQLLNYTYDSKADDVATVGLAVLPAAVRNTSFPSPSVGSTSGTRHTPLQSSSC